MSVKANKPPIVNTQCVVYLFQCDLCDANYVGYTARHLHQRISEHRYSVIGNHLETHHGNTRIKTAHFFKVLKKCNSKFDCLVYEMLYIKDIKPSLNTQADSIHAKLFTWHFLFLFFLLLCFLPWELYPLDPQIFYLLFEILYIRFTVCCPVSGRYHHPDTWNKNSIFEAPRSALGKRSILNESWTFQL